jgi:two-component system chemotaxis response regulator CheB
MAAIRDRSLDVVVLVGSAGGIKPMESVLEGLPSTLDAAVIVLLHLTPQHPSVLAAILGRKTAMNVKQAEDGDLLEPGHVYVAPPNAHLIVNADGTLSLDHSPVVHHVRPSADTLLRSLAENYDGRCLAVVLSGTGIDGAEGAAALKGAGGSVVAQDEATSEHFGMPSAAIGAGSVDAVLAVGLIGQAVVDFVGNRS